MGERTRVETMERISEGRAAETDARVCRHMSSDADADASSEGEGEGRSARVRRFQRPQTSQSRSRTKARVVGRRKSSFDDLRGISLARARASRSCVSDDESERQSLRTFAGDVTVSDVARRRALEERHRKMRALPRGSRYAKRQLELIDKALEILGRVKARGGKRTSEEEDELAGLLKAVKL